MLAERLMMSAASGSGAFPEKPTEYTLIETVTASGEWTAPSTGYFEIELQGASGNGGASTKCKYGTYTSTHSVGGGGGGGGCARSIVKLNQGDTVSLALSGPGEVSTATVNSTVNGAEYNSMTVTSGEAGGAAELFSGGAGGAGGVGSGGNLGNYTGEAGTNGSTKSDLGSGVSTPGASGGAPGYSGGNAGSTSAAVPGGSVESPVTYPAVPGSAGFCKIYAGDTNIREQPDVAASVSPTDGVTYTDGIADLDAETLSLFSQAISENGDITRDTTVVYIDAGELHRKISIANQIFITFNGTLYAFDVIGFNHDSLTDPTAYGLPTQTGRAGITFQMHVLFADTISVMNSSNTNSGGWKSSAMRTSTMATMKGYLPDDWEAIIKPVDKASGTGGGSSSGTETVSDSCFLLAEIEIFGSTTYSVSGEGNQYAYYKAGNSKVKNRKGSADYWWERSPRSGNNYYFCVVASDGTASMSGAMLHYGVSFAFCI